MTEKIRVFTGMKATGLPHLGNYYGSILPAVRQSQDTKNEVILLCADWHGLTNKSSLDVPGRFTHPLVASFLALGFQLQNNAIILQSDFPQIQENAWYLACTCSAGLLERSHAYKDALASGKEATAGLLFYPVLMASDIVTFDAHVVPVGKDQAQHLEYASDMVKLFNNAVSQRVFLEPKAYIQEVPSLPGLDGRKMSKSYHNTIPLFESKKEIEKAVKNIKTDSKGLNDPKNPEECLVFNLFQSFASPEATAHMRTSLERGAGYGYGHAKSDFLDEFERVFSEKRALYEHFLQNPEEVRKSLQEGMERCTRYANATTKRARLALGLQSYCTPSYQR